MAFRLRLNLIMIMLMTKMAMLTMMTSMVVFPCKWPPLQYQHHHHAHQHQPRDNSHPQHLHHHHVHQLQLDQIEASWPSSQFVHSGQQFALETPELMIMLIIKSSSCHHHVIIIVIISTKIIRLKPRALAPSLCTVVNNLPWRPGASLATSTYHSFSSKLPTSNLKVGILTLIAGSLSKGPKF